MTTIYYVPPTEETDQKKINQSIQLIGGAAATATDNIATNTASIATLNGYLPASGQVAFPATQNPSSNPNVLDDYEEGTFTPALQFGGGATGITYSSQTGVYTKIGRAVLIRVFLVLTSKGSSTGAAVITAMPFTVNGTIPGLLRLNNGAAAAATQVTSIFVDSTTSLNLEKFAAGAITTMADTDLTNTSTILVSGQYFV